MAVVRAGIDDLIGLVRAGRATAAEIGRAGGELATSYPAPAGLRGLAVEWTWLATHLAAYPAGLLHEQLRVPVAYRTDPLPPAQRGVVEQTGADRVHIVGHSLGGLIARYYVQRMGGSAIVDTLGTLGSPHGGTRTAYLLPTPVARQLRPGSELLSELALPAPGCRTRFLVTWSRMDQRHARLDHPDLEVEELELHDVGHICLPIDSRSLHWVATALARSDRRHPPFRGRRPPSGPGSATVGARSSPAS